MTEEDFSYSCYPKWEKQLAGKKLKKIEPEKKNLLYWILKFFEPKYYLEKDDRRI